MLQRYFIGNHKNEDICKKSSSGGAFTAITDAAFQEEKNTVVYGCILNEKLDALHIRATSIQERDKMRGSKYISSNMGDCFELVEKDLKNDKFIIFSGTPCQIAGLYSYLNVKNLDVKRLLTIEVICHGVGSNKFFHDYVEHLEKKYKSKAISCNFRAKRKPGKLQDMEISFANGKKYNASTTKFDWFYSAYHNNIILKPSCFYCKYACKERIADISIGDAWKNGDTKKAQSLLISNSDKGLEWIKKVENTLILREIESSKFYFQPNMQRPSIKPLNYEEFWGIYNEKGYLVAQKFIGNNTFKGKIKVLLANIANRLNITDFLKKVKQKGK